MNFLIMLLIPTLSFCVVTNPFRNDGFGAQYYSIILSAIYAETQNEPFIYTPFSVMEHNYNDDLEFLNKKERLINFTQHFPSEQSRSFQEQHAPDPYALAHFFMKNINDCITTSAYSKIKRIFRENKQRADYFDDGTHVAIHIRRPNRCDQPPFGVWYPSHKEAVDATYLTVIDLIRKDYPFPIFHIYSQGEIEDFSKFEAPDVIFHLNDSIEDTFSAMVFADVLVNFPNSAFSYSAGLLSDGIVYYFDALEMPPLPQWIKMKRDW